MIDWAEGTEVRNYGVKRVIQPGNLAELLRYVSFLVVIAVSLTFYLWIQCQSIRAGYQRQQLMAKEEALLREQSRLILQEQMLKDPERIDTLARSLLGMAPIQPNQFILSSAVDTEQIGSNALAMSRTSSPSQLAKLLIVK